MTRPTVPVGFWLWTGRPFGP